jgi:hypothetical protein
MRTLFRLASTATPAEAPFILDPSAGGDASVGDAGVGTTPPGGCACAAVADRSLAPSVAPLAVRAAIALARRRWAARARGASGRTQARPPPARAAAICGRWHGVVLGSALLATSCATSRPRVVVDLITDFAPVVEFARVRTEVLGSRGSTRDRADAPADRSSDYVGGVRVAELGVEAGDHTLRVTLLDAAGRTLVGRSVRVSVRRDIAVTVPIARSCLDVVCPAPGGDGRLTECAGGRCVDPTCRPEAPATCAPPACTADRDCAPMAACAVPRCLSGDCFYADEGACGAAAWCHPVDGCRDRVPLADAGMHDAGSDDAGTGDAGPADAAGMLPDAPVPIDAATPDTTPPVVVIASAPPDPTTSGSASFSFTGTDAGSGIDRFECRIGGEAFAPCTSPYARGGLPDGRHRFEVRAWDRAMNVSAPAAHGWTIDTGGPTIDIAPIADPRPTAYAATASVGFSFSCSDLLGACDLSTTACDVDGIAVACGTTGGSVAVGYTGPFPFGPHVLGVGVRDTLGNAGRATRAFTVTRCAGDLQYPNRTSDGVTRGACCAGLEDTGSWYDPFESFWHPRGDGSCRPGGDYVAREWETVWGPTACGVGDTTAAWLQARGLPGCGSVRGRAACVTSQATAQAYCGTDGGSGTQTPFHARASEGWHPPPSAGCQSGVLSGSLLMRRYGADDVCFGTVDVATSRGSVSATDSCAGGLTRFCRSSPPSPTAAAVPCVCTTVHPYAADGRN